MIRFAMLSIPAVSLLISGSALSQESIANRYTMEKTENGLVRLDTLTGEMSICTEKTGQMVCRLPADERTAYEETLSDLAARVAELEQRLDALAPSSQKSGIPDDAELDQALGAMEKVMRRFFGMVQELQKDFDGESKAPTEPVPDRT